MANNLKKRIVMILQLIFTIFSIFAFEKKFEQKLSWKGDKNALEYKVEIAENEKSEDEEQSVKILKSVTTTELFITINLTAGNYKYRVFAIDYLGRESSVSEWQEFTVYKAMIPELVIAQNEIEVSKKQKNGIEIPVDIKQITKESKVEIINQETGEVYEGKILETETEDGFKIVEFPKLNDGEWKIKVTNPSGLSKTTDEYVTVKTKVKEKTKIIWPIDLNIMAGAGFKIPFKNELVEYGNEKGFPVSIESKISYLPFENRIFSFGFETDFDMMFYNYISEEFDIGFNVYGATLLALARINLLNNKLGICLKAGAGIAFLQRNFKSYSDAVSAVPLKSFGYLCIKTGAGVQYIPLKHLILEAGVDYTMIFIPDVKMNCISPYICFGVRL